MYLRGFLILNLVGRVLQGMPTWAILKVAIRRDYADAAIRVVLAPGFVGRRNAAIHGMDVSDGPYGEGALFSSAHSLDHVLSSHLLFQRIHSPQSPTHQVTSFHPFNP